MFTARFDDKEGVADRSQSLRSENAVVQND